MLVVQIISAASLLAMVTVQTKGSGLGRAWGQARTSSFTRRGLERFLFKATFVVALIFLVASIVQVMV